ncbi:cell division control protein 2 homolog D-like [Zingiber officinale]|uniref:cell division control protein 2 homolog D-like n=1 Tax=Zingiber officinale TaxID=94328 RepID=UPI001C4CD043|nr:cell division control protein 2 homolog D-like [Zingiber officinale]
MDAFEKLEKVREGTYGKVYKAREKATGKIVALKKTLLPEDDEGVPPTTLREVSLLRMLSIDPHVVRLLDLKQDQNKEGQTILYIVFEYMDTDMKKYIRSFRQSMPPMTVRILMYQLCKGISFCHGHGVLHRDLKPHNILMDRKTMMLKVADLGLSRAFTIPLKTYTHELPVSVGAKSKSRGTIASGASRISQDKSPMPTSYGDFHNSSTISHVPVLAFAAPNLK